MADTTPSQPDGTSRPARQYRPSRGRRVGDAILSVFIRAGLVPSSYLLTTRGRKTGRPRTNPVTVVEHDGKRWLVAPLRARVVGAQRPRRRAGHPAPPARHACLHHPRGRTPGGRTRPQALRRHRHGHATVLPGRQGRPGGGLRRRGGPPPGVRAHTHNQGIALTTTVNSDRANVGCCRTSRIERCLAEQRSSRVRSMVLTVPRHALQPRTCRGAIGGEQP